MKNLSQDHARALCPHLAAAVLWMSNGKRTTRSGKQGLNPRAHPVLDRLRAL